MNPITFELLLKESIFGLLVMTLVIIYIVYSFSWISLTYRKVLGKSRYLGHHLEMLRFVAFVMLLIIAMLFSLTFWVVALTYFNFVPDWVSGLLFAASFFTSVGNFVVTLPFGWRLIPSIIAFSGLFTFAWATSASITMARNLGDYLDKHNQL